ncbi:hypothetical protein [Bradyrhizobium guangdongense]
MQRSTTTPELSDLNWLLEKLNVLLTSFKILVLGTAALIALGFSSVLLGHKLEYASSMVVPLTSRTRAVIKTGAVLDPVIRSTHLGIDFPHIEVAREVLQRRLVISQELSPGSGLYSLSFTDQTPEQAQAVLNQFLAQIIALSKPVGTARVDTLQQIESLKQTLFDLKSAAAAITANANKEKGGSEGEMYARALVVLVSEIATKEHTLWTLQNGLDGLRLEDIPVKPTLPSLPEPAGTLRKLTVVAIGSFCLMALVVLIRHERKGRSTFQNKWE